MPYTHTWVNNLAISGFQFDSDGSDRYDYSYPGCLSLLTVFTLAGVLRFKFTRTMIKIKSVFTVDLNRMPVETGRR
jgi:hypothetical protein